MSYPCPNGSGFTGTYYTSTGASTAWNRCQTISGGNAAPGCAEGMLVCMTITLYYVNAFGVCTACGTASQTYCGNNVATSCSSLSITPPPIVPPPPPPTSS